MAQLLEVSRSSYFPAFKDLFKEIVGAMEEAQDISDNLKPIAGHFESLETTEFDQIKPAFDPMFHTICLIWSHSKHYCRPARIIVLLQELNNLIIKKATEFAEPLDLFKGEPEESVEKIRVCFASLDAYKKSYETYRAKVKEYFKNGLPAREWEFTPKLVFARYDKFIDKMEKIRVNIFFNN
jgi:dynein heavy chain